MKLHLLFINLLFISSATIQINSMQNNLESIVVRTVAFGASSAVAAIGLGIGAFGLAVSYADSHKRYRSDLGHIVGPLISVPSMLIGSFATYSALLAIGIKNKSASKVAGTVFGGSMLLTSLGNWINAKNCYFHDEKSFCAGTGVFTGIVGLAALTLFLRR